MALKLVEEEAGERHPTVPLDHVCVLPWPADPSLSEGHVCECGRRWCYQPAHWEPLLTIDQMRDRQRSGEYGRGVIQPL